MANLRHRISSRKTIAHLVIIVMAALVLELISAFQYYYTRGLLEQELKHRAESELIAKKALISSVLALTETTVKEHQWDIKAHLPQADAMFPVTQRLIESNPLLSGSFICFAPYFYPEKGRLFETYAYHNAGHSDSIEVKQIASDSHDYTLNADYLRVIRERKPSWSSPYFYNNDSTQYLITYSMPIVSDRGPVAAVYGVDLPLNWLSDTLNTDHMYKSSFYLIYDQEGKLIVGPSAQHAKANDVKFITQQLNDRGDDPPTPSNSYVKSLKFEDPTDHSEGYIFYTALDDAPHWHLAVVCYDDEVYEKLYKMQFNTFLFMLAALLVLGFIVNRFARNEKKLLVANMKQESINNELHIASVIQQNMLPDNFRQQSERDDLDIFALLKPAKEVGGDLYDYFIRDEKLFFCIGDVSGKGIPSAIVMAVIQSLFRMASATSSDPSQLMKSINEMMCQRNKQNMFVTFFIGVLDLPTGHFSYCNAGHDTPFTIEHSPLEVHPNLPIGVFDDFDYSMQEMQLQPDTTLFLYTDGLTEAKNKERELFGMQRLTDVLEESRKRKLGPEELINNISQKVRQFVGEEEQSDDLTLLAIRYQRHEGKDH